MGSLDSLRVGLVMVTRKIQSLEGWNLQSTQPQHVQDLGYASRVGTGVTAVNIFSYQNDMCRHQSYPSSPSFILSFSLSPFFLLLSYPLFPSFVL